MRLVIRRGQKVGQNCLPKDFGLNVLIMAKPLGQIVAVTDHGHYFLIHATL
jgi:hypothetical protein